MLLAWGAVFSLRLMGQSVSFISPLDYPLASTPSSIAVADFNGDGLPDLAIACRALGRYPSGPSGVILMLAKSDGTFQNAVDLLADRIIVDWSAFGYVDAIAVADFNGDGKPDVAVTGWLRPLGSQSYLGILLNNGDGTFKPQPLLTFSWSVAHQLVVGDFNGDGKIDIVSSYDSSDTMSLLLGKGDGTFLPPTAIQLGMGASFVAVGDINGDGRPDLVVTLPYYNNIAVLLNNGGGTFRQAPRIEIEKSPSFVSISDVNRDGKADLVVTNQDSTSVSVLVGSGDGTFRLSGVYAVGRYPVYALLADVSGDGIADLIVANQESDNLSLLLGKGDGSFQPASPISLGSGPTAITAMDFNRDGVADLAVTNGSSDSLSIALGCGGTKFLVPAVFEVQDVPTGLIAQDFNRDGAVDLAVANTGSDSVSILQGDGQGNFRSASTLPVGKAPTSLAGGDFNGDAIPDLAVFNNASGDISVLLGAGDGNFRQAVNYSRGTSSQWYLSETRPNTIVVGDFNGDKKIDIAALNDTSVSVLLGNGDGTFQPPRTVPVGADPRSIAVGDFDGDGRSDIVVVGSGADGVSLLLGLADGSFRRAMSAPLADYLHAASVVVGDFNRDGNLDLGVAFVEGTFFTFQSSVAILLGDGTGKFQSLPAYQYVIRYPGSYPFGISVAVGDVNGDGVLDLLLTNEVTYHISAFLGNGDGSLQAPVDSLSGTSSRSMVISDFDNDGRLDVALTNRRNLGSGVVSVILNNTDPARVGLQTMNAAGYQLGAVAADSIAAVFGKRLAPQTAGYSGTPPLTLGGATVEVTDIAGIKRSAPMFYASDGQITFLVPAGTATGAATVTVTRPAGVLSGTVNIAAVAPGICTVNSASSVPAAFYVRVPARGIPVREPVFDPDSGTAIGIPRAAGDAIYLELFGTGMRHFSGSVTVTANGESVPVIQGAPPGAVRRSRSDRRGTTAAGLGAR